MKVKSDFFRYSHQKTIGMVDWEGYIDATPAGCGFGRIRCERILRSSAPGLASDIILFSLRIEGFMKDSCSLFSEEVDLFFYTPKQCEILRSTVIGIAGAGGIGSNCATILVRSGFTRFVIADFDCVTATNLNRQTFNAKHIGRLKVECLAEICSEINPQVQITTVSIRIDQVCVHRIFDQCDIIIEAFDDAAAKALLFSEYLHTSKLLIGVNGIAGIGNSDAIKTTAIRESCFMVGDNSSEACETLKPYAPRVITAAAKMADIALFKTLCPLKRCD